MKKYWSLLGLILALSFTVQAQAQLLIHSARWQADDGESCDASAKLRRVCNGQRHCRLPAERSAMCHPDPDWGQEKVLYVSYSCNGVRQIDKSFPDGRKINLLCDTAGNRAPHLHINWARWVGEGRGSCDATAKVIANCDGRDVCNLFANSNNLCGYDPARGVRKRLDVNYRCGDRPNRLDSFDEDELVSMRCDAAYPDVYDKKHADSWKNSPNDRDVRDESASTDGSLGTAIAGAIIGAILDGINDNNDDNSDNNNDDENDPRWRKDTNPKLNFYANKLKIHSARWEVIGGGPWCDATRQFDRACDGRAQCQLGVNQYSLCSDPAPDRIKRVSIKYSCDLRMQPMASFRDGEQAILRCPNGQPAAVPVQPNRPSRPDNSVGPVRPIAPIAPIAPVAPIAPAAPATPAGPNRPSWPTSVERPYPNNPPAQVTTPSNSGEPLAITRASVLAGNWAGCDATPKVAIACNGKRYCQVAVQVQTLCSRDPAPGQAKTLEINYLCHGRPQAKQSFAEGAQAVLRCD